MRHYTKITYFLSILFFCQITFAKSNSTILKSDNGFIFTIEKIENIFNEPHYNVKMITQEGKVKMFNSFKNKSSLSTYGGATCVGDGTSGYSTVIENDGWTIQIATCIIRGQIESEVLARHWLMDSIPLCYDENVITRIGHCPGATIIFKDGALFN